jgi:hypothetical protein
MWMDITLGRVTHAGIAACHALGPEDGLTMQTGRRDASFRSMYDCPDRTVDAHSGGRGIPRSLDWLCERHGTQLSGKRHVLDARPDQ